MNGEIGIPALIDGMFRAAAIIRMRPQPIDPNDFLSIEAARRMTLIALSSRVGVVTRLTVAERT